MILGMSWRLEVLPDDTQFKRFPDPPTQPGVQPQIAWRCSIAAIDQLADVIKSGVPFQAVGQVQERVDLKLMFGRLMGNCTSPRILAGRVACHVHLQVGITWGDLPAMGDAPTGKDFGAVVVRVRPIVKEKWSDQYGRPGA